MYSCEKLARGGKRRIEYDESKHHIYHDPLINKQVNSKYEYNFADPRKYAVQIELYEDRHRCRVLSKRRK